MTGRRAVGRASAAVALAAGAALVAAPAWAAPSTDVVQSTVLRIVSVADWSEAADLLPGESVQWDLTVSADPGAEPGTVTLALSATGAAPLLVDADLCLQPWTHGECPGGAAVLTASWAIPRDGSEAVLTDFPSTQTAHLRLRMAMGGDDDRPGFTDVRVSARGVGDAVAAGTGGGLPATGGTAPVGVLIGGGALLGAGAVVLAGRIGRRGRIGGERRGRVGGERRERNRRAVRAESGMRVERGRPVMRAERGGHGDAEAAP